MGLSLIFTGTAPLPLFERSKINLLNVEINEIIMNYKLKPKKCGKKEVRNIMCYKRKQQDSWKTLMKLYPLHILVCAVQTHRFNNG